MSKILSFQHVNNLMCILHFQLISSQTTHISNHLWLVTTIWNSMHKAVHSTSFTTLFVKKLGYAPNITSSLKYIHFLKSIFNHPFQNPAYVTSLSLVFKSTLLFFRRLIFKFLVLLSFCKISQRPQIISYVNSGYHGFFFFWDNSMLPYRLFTILRLKLPFIGVIFHPSSQKRFINRNVNKR